MPELLTMQDLANGHLDVQALGEAANGDENTIVTTRTGETYPSVKGSIKTLFENGGLPATPFATKALMTASALVDDKYAMVTDDAANNGLYVKTSGAWVKSAYDISAIMQHVAIRELFNKNNREELLDSLFYKNKVPANYKYNGYISSTVTSTPLKWVATSGGLIYGYPVVAGTRYTIETINLPSDPESLAYKVFYGVYTKTPLRHGEYAESFWERLPSTDGATTKMEFVVPEGMKYIYINVQHNGTNLYASDLVIYPTAAGNTGLEIPSYLEQTEESISKALNLALPESISNHTVGGYVASAITTKPYTWVPASESTGTTVFYDVVEGQQYSGIADNFGILFYGAFYTTQPVAGQQGIVWDDHVVLDADKNTFIFTVPEGYTKLGLITFHAGAVYNNKFTVLEGDAALTFNPEIDAILGHKLIDREAREAISSITGGSIGGGSWGDKTHKNYDYNHFLIHGQSLATGTNSGAVISTTQPYSNVTLDGGVNMVSAATSFKPLVEVGLETPCSAASNMVSREYIKNGKGAAADYRVISTTAGVGGRTIESLSEGGAYWSRVVAQMNSGKEVSAGLNKSYAVHAVGWIQGEANNQPASFPTQLHTRSQYYNSLIALHGQLDELAKNITGQSETVKLITYQVSFSSLAHADVALAQLDAVQKNPNFGLSTPTYHIQHSSDRVHLTALGYKHMGAYFGRAYYQFIIEGRKPDYINPRNVVNNNGVITIEFDVPKLPLVIDAVKLASTEDSGFKVVGAVSRTKLPISSITTDSNKVVISLETPTTEQVEVRYGLDYVGTGLNIINAASGNLRDSTTETVTVSGQVLPLFHVCPHFKLLSFKDSGI